MKSLLSRLRPKPHRHIESDADPEKYLVLGNPLRTAEIDDFLTVKSGETVLLIERGNILQRLNPGLYQLSLKQLDDLKDHFSWPDDYTGTIEAELCFVSTRLQHQLRWEIKSEHHPFFASGRYSFRIDNMSKLISELDIHDYVFDSDCVEKLACHTLARSLEKFIEATPLSLQQLITVPKDTCKLSTPLIEQDFDTIGLVEFGFSITKFESTGQNEPTENTEPVETKPDTDTDLNRFEVLNEYAATDELPPFHDAKLPEMFKDTHFYVVLDGEQHGPYSAEVFEEAIKDGSVEPNTLIWFGGLENWTPVTKIEELHGMFSWDQLQ